MMGGMGTQSASLLTGPEWDAIIAAVAGHGMKSKLSSRNDDDVCPPVVDIASPCFVAVTNVESVSSRISEASMYALIDEPDSTTVRTSPADRDADVLLMGKLLPPLNPSQHVTLFLSKPSLARIQKSSGMITTSAIL